MVEKLNYSPEIGEIVKPMPYVVSEDIGILLNEWCTKRGFMAPKPDFVAGLRQEFSQYMGQIFPGFEMVPERELVEELRALVDQTGLYPVSFDRVYYQTESKLDMTRLVDESGGNKGLGRRPNSAPLLKQFRTLKERGEKDVVLIDDVVFTGRQITRTAELLSRMGIKVKAVCAGIGIEEGIEQLNGYGQEVYCVRRYKQVIDEICERDFYPGVPMSGRSLQGNENIGVPYVLPFGNPGQWASIPEEWQEPLSRFCIGQSIKLFDEIGRRSGKEVVCEDLDRAVVLLPRDGTKVAEALRRFL